MIKTEENKKYWFEYYTPPKGAKPVVYKGTRYLSKAQCMALEGITKSKLDSYLKKHPDEKPVETPVEEVSTEEITIEGLPDDYFNVE